MSDKSISDVTLLVEYVLPKLIDFSNVTVNGVKNISYGRKKIHSSRKAKIEIISEGGHCHEKHTILSRIQSA